MLVGWKDAWIRMNTAPLAMRLLGLPVVAALFLGPLPARGERLVHTYSIVARDPATGEMGVAVQSHAFSAGSLAIWGEAGVGVVATQSFVDPAYGPNGLTLLRTGRSASEALTGLLAADPGRDTRQVAILDAEGRVAAHTGKGCIAAAGHLAGDNFSVQANLMTSDAVWPAMAKAYASTKADLAGRLLAALEAAEAAGGDIRGRQSAALLVVKAKSTGKPWEDKTFDLRVDDHAEPLKELRRLATMQRAVNHLNAAGRAVERKDEEGALREFALAEALVPDNAEILFWHAVTLVNLGRVEDSLPVFRKVFAMDSRWREVTGRLAKVGILPAQAAARITSKE